MTAGTTEDRRTLEFTGLSSGSGDLTWGQRFVWDILESLAPVNHYLSIRFRVHLPSDATVERVLEALHALVRRHDGLRTRFAVSPDGAPYQECDSSGELTVLVRDAEPGGVRRIADQEEDRLWREPFRHEEEWPLRVCLITADARPRQAVFVFSHLAADAWGCAVFRREFLALVRSGGDGGAQGESAPATPAWQPLDRAAFEGSLPGRHIADTAAAYWRRTLDTMPQTAFPVRPSPYEQPRFPGVALRSDALAAVVQAVAAKYRVGPAAVVVAALSTVIGIRTGADAVPLMLAAGNRLTPKDIASVGTFYQAAPVVVRVDHSSLADTVRATGRASTLAYLRGQSDPRAIARLLDEVREQRGIGIDLVSTVNVVPEPGGAGPSTMDADIPALRAMTASTVVSDLEGRAEENLKLYFHVKALRTRAEVELFCDSGYLTTVDARRILAGLEVVLIELLTTGDLDSDRVAELVGIAPLDRPAGSVLVDHCWVDLAQTRTLLREIPEIAASQVFVDGGGDGPPRLIAYLTTARPATPEQIHAAFLPKLDGNLTMAPHWYVVCGDAPLDPGSRSAWEAQAVLTQGSGRGEPGAPSPDSRSIRPVEATLGV